MSPTQALEALRWRFPDAALQAPDAAPRATVEPDALRGHLQYLRDELGYGYLVFMTAVDRPEQSRFELVYRLFSYDSKCAVAIHLFLPREAARVASVCDLFRTAEWHERETAENFGRDLILGAEQMGVVLRKTTDPRHAVEFTGLFPAVNGAELREAHG